MSDNQRHVRELANPRYYSVDSATVIEIGDNVWQDTNDVKPASDFTWNASLAQTQADFKAKYIGMSADRSRAGDTNDVGVDKNGIKKFTCASASFEIGDLVGPAKASGNALENQKVVAVASEDYAIGRVAKRYAAVTTEVEVDIRTFLDDFSNNDSTASIIANIEASGTLTADAIIDGTTNHVFTALDDTKLGGIEASADVTDVTNVAAAGAFIIGTNDADDITDGTTNHVFTALDDTKLGNIHVDKLAAVVHTVVADEDTANLADIDTGLGSTPDVFIVQILRSGVDVKSDAIVTALGGGDAGKIRVADGGATYVLTAGDVIHIIAAEV